MRYALAALMGLIALGGIQARALPGVSNALDTRAPELDFTPVDNALSDELTKRVTTGAPGARPPPVTRPPPTRPGSTRTGNTRTGNGRTSSQRPGSPEDDGTELSDLEDETDVITTKPCGAAKRGLSDLFDAPFIKRMSGTAYALDWPGWEDILKQLDKEYAIELGKLSEADRAGRLRIIWAGGISGIRLGARGTDGKTGDIDFTYDINTPQALRDAFFRAIKTVIAKNPEKLNQKPNKMQITNSLDNRASDAKKQAWSATKNPVAFPGENFDAVDGDWDMQLFGKMNRMYQMREKNANSLKQRDVDDSKKFVEQFKAANGGRDLTLQDFTDLGEFYDKDEAYTEEMVAKTIKLVVGEAMLGVEQKIKDLVAKFKC